MNFPSASSEHLAGQTWRFTAAVKWVTVPHGAQRGREGSGVEPPGPGLRDRTRRDPAASGPRAPTAARASAALPVPRKARAAAFPWPSSSSVASVTSHRPGQTNRVHVTRFSVPALAEGRWRRRSLVGGPKSLISRPSDTWVLFSRWFFEAINLDSGILKLDRRRQPTPPMGPRDSPLSAERRSECRPSQRALTFPRF